VDVTGDLGLLRERVDALLAEGVRWRASYRWGAFRREDVGRGLVDLPLRVLTHLPTEQTARRLAQGRLPHKALVRASLVEDEDGPLLLLVEP
jgi:hypothetical protein